MAWGGRSRTTAAVTTAAVLAAVSAGCAGGVDQAHSVQTRIGRISSVMDVDVEVPTPDRAARIEVGLSPGVDDAGVLALVASVDEVATREAYPSYRLDLREPGTGDVLVVDDTFTTDVRAAEVVASWRRAASAFVGGAALTYEGGRTTVVVTSDGGMAHDVAESSRIPLPPAPVTWRFESGPGTVVLDGRVAPADVDLVERVLRGVVSPSLPAAAVGWRLDRRRTQAQLDLLTDPGSLRATDLVPATWGPQVAPLVRVALDALGQPRRRVVLRLGRPLGDGTDVYAWWTSDRPPTPGRDRLDRGWDAWLATQAR